ncbi:MAG: MBL fold metallo-hydrolase [Kiritimatiellae bacterium]|nr:MBL fold metallo-hydrolase [Kiritimatiellia bacterium]
MDSTRRDFIGGAAALAACGAAAADAASPAGRREKLKVRFLGTGAADWRGRDKRGELRRLTSMLVDGRILVDFTSSALDMLPQGCRPETVFYTHSHGDHYNPAAAIALGVRRAYVHESWSRGAAAEFRAAAEKAGRPAPEILSLSIGEAVEAGGARFTALPANHATGRKGEQTVIYLIEKGSTRLLYATDTSGIPAVSARLAGIDAHGRPGKPVTALVMEATIGLGREDDYRIFTHSSVAMVAQVVRVLTKTKRYVPASGQPVYLTHMARTLHGTQAELDKALPAPLKAAYDGLEVEF